MNNQSTFFAPMIYLNTVAPAELAFTVGGRMPARDLAFGWRSRFVAEQDETVTRPLTDAFDVHRKARAVEAG